MSITMESHRIGKDLVMNVYTQDSDQIWYQIIDSDWKETLIDGSEMDNIVQIYLKKKKVDE